MTIHCKRILILFSVALNIGFAITAVAMFYQHPPAQSPTDFRVFAEKAIARLDLPPEREKQMVAIMDKFGQEREDSRRRFHQTRSNMLSLLARQGPLDQRQFDVITKEVDQLVVLKHSGIRKHVLEMRKQLGDEKGAAFFAAILAQVDAGKECP